MARFYITTSIMYANAAPHVGFALELVQADAVARYRRMMGDDVRFSTGTDEHGIKNLRAAEAAGVTPQAHVDAVAAQVELLADRLDVSNTDFIRTSDREKHWPAALKLWEKLAEKGDIYKKSYEGLYCVGHEAFIRPSELVDGMCPDHGTAPEKVSEENWFFRLSAYKTQVRDALESGRVRIVPERRKQEILNLLEDADDVSFSRPSQHLPWGIPVPGDASQVMYVWADALANYLSVLGYGADEAGMAFWPADVHLVGKDIVRFHAIYWPAMLLAAGLELPRNLYVHGFITVDGQKMSKTLGNVVSPAEILDRWPTDVIRYFLLRELQSTDDSDFSWKNIENRYVSDLANGLGNLVQRTATLIATKLGGTAVARADEAGDDDKPYHDAFAHFRLHDAAAYIWERIAEANAYLNSREPWKQDEADARVTLEETADKIRHIARLLAPFMPATAAAISARFSGGVLTAGEPLFPRLK